MTDLIDTTILNTFSKNRFSSALFISRITKLNLSDVEQSILRLLNKRKIFQSVKGVPHRFSSIEEDQNLKNIQLEDS